MKKKKSPKVASSLSDAAQILDLLAPQPSSNAGDLVPGVSSLGDVGRALTNLQAPPASVQKSKRLGFPRAPTPGVVEYPSTAQAPSSDSELDLSSLAPTLKQSDIPTLESLRTPLSKDDEEIKQIMDARKRIREQQTALSQVQNPNDPRHFFAALGALGADAYGSQAGTPTVDSVVGNVAQQRANAQQLRLKALEGESADQTSLLQLAKARQAQKAALAKSFADRKANFENQKKLIDYRAQRNPKPSGPKVGMKDYTAAQRSLEGIKAMQGVVDTVYGMDVGKFGANTGIWGKAKSFLGYSNPETEKERQHVKNMQLPVAITMSAGKAPTDMMLKKVQELFPDIDKEEAPVVRGKVDAIMPKLFVDAEAQVKALEAANDPRAQEFRAQLEASKREFETKQKGRQFFPREVRRDGQVATVNNAQELKDAIAEGWQ